MALKQVSLPLAKCDDVMLPLLGARPRVRQAQHSRSISSDRDRVAYHISTNSRPGRANSDRAVLALWVPLVLLSALIC